MESEARMRTLMGFDDLPDAWLGRVRIDMEKPTLGHGSDAIVYRCEHAGVEYAAKVLHGVLIAQGNVAREDFIRRFGRECCLLRKLSHPCVLDFIGAGQGPNRSPCLVVELMEETLADRVTAEPADPFLQSLSYLLDVAGGLRYLHWQRIMHRDLKPRNVLVTAGKAKIADMGLARSLHGDEPMATQMMSRCPGTPFYMAPECMEGGRPVYDDKIDMFAMGVIVLEVFTHHEPSPKVRQIIDRVPMTELERREEDLGRMDPDHLARPLVVSCLQDDPALRPTATQAHHLLMIFQQGFTAPNKPLVSATLARLDTAAAAQQENQQQRVEKQQQSEERQLVQQQRQAEQQQQIERLQQQIQQIQEQQQRQEQHQQQQHERAQQQQEIGRLRQQTEVAGAAEARQQDQEQQQQLQPQAQLEVEQPNQQRQQPRQQPLRHGARFWLAVALAVLLAGIVCEVWKVQQQQLVEQQQQQMEAVARAANLSIYLENNIALNVMEREWTLVDSHIPSGDGGWYTATHPDGTLYFMKTSDNTLYAYAIEDVYDPIDWTEVQFLASTRIWMWTLAGGEAGVFMMGKEWNDTDFSASHLFMLSGNNTVRLNSSIEYDIVVKTRTLIVGKDRVVFVHICAEDRKCGYCPAQVLADGKQVWGKPEDCDTGECPVPILPSGIKSPRVFNVSGTVFCVAEREEGRDDVVIWKLTNSSGPERVEWRNMSSDLPHVPIYAGVTPMGRGLAIAGGLPFPAGSPMSRVFFVDLKTNQTIEFPDLPGVMTDVALGFHGQHLLLFGRQLGNGTKRSVVYKLHVQP